jgi:hypothetical protein
MSETVDLGRQYQTIMGGPEADPPGDCLRAAVASLVGVPAADVPHFVTSPHWWRDMRTWAKETLGKDFTKFRPVSGTVRHLVDTDVVIGIGPSPRGPWGHAVLVTPDLSLVHDPHPDRTGVESVIYVLALTDPEDTP